MASSYNAVSQMDHEVASNASDSDCSRSSSRERQKDNAFRPLSLDLSNLGGSDFMDAAKPTQDSRLSRLGSIMHPATPAAYDILDEDDYEVAEASPGQEEESHAGRATPPLRILTAVEPSSRPLSPEEPTLRSPSSDHPVPLSHPIPDLQSLQGAYVGNVERLEKSAARLSMSSTDIGSEIRKMDREQKRRSCSTASNSTQIRNGAFSPQAHFSSPRGSVRSSRTRLRSPSASRLTQLAEPDDEDDGGSDRGSPISPILPPIHRQIQEEHSSASNYDNFSNVDLGESADRPATAASGDTYQQARVLFRDFDGVHFVHHENNLGVSLTKPPLATRSESFKEPRVGEDMIYYPAPVPMMLNLPPRLSKKPASDQRSVSERENRQTQASSSTHLENRKSAAVPPAELDQEATDSRLSKRLTKLPPHLRASALFDRPAARIELEVQHASPVATLDSILDASAHAPVTAFTDHPFVGREGANVYKKSKGKLSSANVAPMNATRDNAEQKKKNRLSKSPFALRHLPKSTPALLSKPEEAHETASLRRPGASHHGDHSSSENSDDDSGESSSSEEEETGEEERGREHAEEEEEEEEEVVDYIGPPSTLLAELQKRKLELQQRRRTAAVSNGMHSTLLQLEAVAQKKSEQRRHKRVTLAWEDPDPQGEDSDEDEDVPLGILYPERNRRADEDRPIGLLQKKEMEESEPLSRRRARLRGEPPPSPVRRASTMPAGQFETGSEDDEGETLAQRLKRLKSENRTSTVTGSEFTTEVLAEIDTKIGNGEKNGGDTKKDEEAPKEEPKEETLGERRRRLQMEAKMQQGQSMGQKAPKARRSMADILQEYPLKPEPMQGPDRSSRLDYPYLNGRRGHESVPNLMSTYQFPSNFGYQGAAVNRHSQYAMANPYAHGNYNTNALVYNNPLTTMGHHQYGRGVPYGYGAKIRPQIDPSQRDMIDRWRQSIMR